MASFKNTICIGSALVAGWHLPEITDHFKSSVDDIKSLPARYAEFTQPYVIEHKLSDPDMLEAAADMSPEDLQFLKDTLAAEAFMCQHEGQVLIYTIKSGDTLYALSRRFDISIDILRAPNAALYHSDNIRAGDSIIIPILDRAPYFDLDSMDIETRLEPLLNLILKIEADGHYDTSYKHRRPDYVPGYAAGLKFTDMTVREVLEWQAKCSEIMKVKSTVVGGFQFKDDTLKDMVNKGVVSMEDRFSPATQKKLAIALIERRGLREFLTHEDASKFLLGLSKEWASIPKDETGFSYYMYYNGNKALCSPEEVIKAMPFSYKTQSYE